MNNDQARQPQTEISKEVPVEKRKRLHTAWAMYDWGNSAYNLVITSTIFPVYYNYVTTLKSDDGKTVLSDEVVLFGHKFHNTALSNYTLALAYAIVVILSPVLSSIAYLKGNKKRFMQLFTYTGSLACCGLYFFGPSSIGWGLFCFMLAAVGYCGSLVFYNSYLPEIATDAPKRSFTFGVGLFSVKAGTVGVPLVRS